MKKFFFLLSVAAVAMTACTNESNEYVGSTEAREITFSPITQNMTRAITDDLAGYTINVAAYDITGDDATKYREFFPATAFTKGTTYWSASEAKYWPLSEANISFLGYTECTGSAAFTKTQTLVLTMTDNSTAQKDLMYACGYGAVTKNGTNGLDFPAKVDMLFKHAQAWIAFTVNADATTDGKITLTSITLNGAKYAGTYTVTHANWDSKTAVHSVSGVWSETGAGSNIAVPGWNEAAVAKKAAGTAVGDGLLVVPDPDSATDFTSFTIAYKLDGKDYSYTYTPTSLNLDLQQGTKYTYNITFKLHEILINPSVENWDASSTSYDIDVI